MYARSIAMSNHYKDLLNNILLGNEKVAHCLVELSLSHYWRMRDNMITVSGFINNNEPYYNSVKYGNNIRFVTKKREQLINTVSDVIDLTKVKYNYCIVVARTEECVKFFPNLCTINIGDLYQHCPIDSVSSGYSILLLASGKRVSKNCSDAH